MLGKKVFQFFLL